MHGTIPVIRVNYTIGQLFKALFICNRSDKYRKQLRKILSLYFSNDNIILTSSARSAIYQLACSLPQHKVVVPAYTCEVVIEALLLAEKEVIFADIDNTTLNINNYPDIDSDTIVIATHQYGILSEVKSLAQVCKQKGAILIEDCAGSFGGRIGSQLTGTFGDYGVFSFSASKTIHSPTKGGFIVAQNKYNYDRIAPLSDIWNYSLVFKIKQLVKGLGFCLANNRILSSWLYRLSENEKTTEEKPINSDHSYHSYMYEWQAYVVLQQLADVDTYLMERRKLFAKYNNGIVNTLIQKPVMQWGGVNIRYAILVEDRDRFSKDCLDNHIAVGRGYQKLYCPQVFKAAHKVSKEIVYLPFGNGFSDKEIEKVINTVNAFK